MKKMPKRAFALGFGCLCAAMLLFSGKAVAAEKAEIHWYTDYTEAAEVAKQSGKPMFLFFTGSDWCSWCKKLQREVLDTPEFASRVGDNFVFVDLDFPRRGSQPQKIREQNEALRQKYDVAGFPAVIILDAQGRKIAVTGYRRGGAAAYADYLDSLKVPMQAVPHS